MQEIKTYTDCKRMSRKTGLSPLKIARAFGITVSNQKTVENRLRPMFETAQKKRNIPRMWDIFKELPIDSRLRLEVLTEILDISYINEDFQTMSEVYNYSGEMSTQKVDAHRKIIILCERKFEAAKEKGDLEAMFELNKYAPENTHIQNEITKEIVSLHI